MERYEEIVRFEESLRGSSDDLQTLASFFDKGDILVVRVPARLDVMGGIADYSGSNVCEGTLGRGVVLGIQKRADDWIKLRTQQLPRDNLALDFAFSLRNFTSGTRLKSYAELCTFFQRNTIVTWAAYLIGAVFTLLKEKKVERFAHGFNVALISSVPMGAGIGSSATVEIAMLYALNQLLGLDLEPLEIARLGQITENHVVGAPCGLMDQISVACGRANELIHILCRPDRIVGMVDIPPDCAFAGINSMVKHSVAGPKYTDTRVATFMGRKIIFEHTKKAEKKRAGSRTALASLTRFYLTSVTPDEFEKTYKRLLPSTISGAQFLDEYGETGDAATEVVPEKTYSVRSRTAHPIHENARVLRFVDALKAARHTGDEKHLIEAADEKHLVEAGAQMYGAHDSYAENCNLSCPEVDFIVEQAKKLGKRRGLYGAKITGGGSGGTVAVMGKRDMLEEAIAEIIEAYRIETGLAADVFFGTSPGAFQFGHYHYRLEWAPRHD
jgi:L-arabinokinase